MITPINKAIKQVEEAIYVNLEHSTRRNILDSERLICYLNFKKALESLLPYEQEFLKNKEDKTFKQKSKWEKVK